MDVCKSYLNKGGSGKDGKAGELHGGCLFRRLFEAWYEMELLIVERDDAASLDVTGRSDVILGRRRRRRRRRREKTRKGGMERLQSYIPHTPSHSHTLSLPLRLVGVTHSWYIVH
jgi:hypothetical protein